MRESIYFGFKDRSTSCPLLSTETLLGSFTTKQMPLECVCHDGNRNPQAGTLLQTLNLDLPTGITRCPKQKPLTPPYGAAYSFKVLLTLYQKPDHIALFTQPWQDSKTLKIGTGYHFVLQQASKAK